MKPEFENMLGVGIYGIPEASRLTGVSRGRIRRWLTGYDFASKSGTRHSPPVWKPELPTIGGDLALTFLDLQEVRFVDAFLKLNVPWKTIRLVEEIARDRYHLSHPFCTLRFKASGRQIFREVEGKVFEFITNQHFFEGVIQPFLKDVDFHGQYPMRWWFLGHNRAVILDPARSFGQPIVDKGGYLTRTIADTLKAEKSIDHVASWYGIERSAVEDAVECEGKLRGRAA